MKQTIGALSCLLFLSATPLALAADDHKHKADIHEEVIDLDTLDDDHGDEDGHDHGHEDGHDHGEKGHDEAGHDDHDEKGHDHGEEAGHGHEAGGHGGHGGHDHGEEGGAIELNAQSIAAAGIRVETVQKVPFAQEIMAPGEVRLNAYHTAHITPRIAGQIIARHARLGDSVRAGQPLATLSSIEMAEAQGQLLVAEQEWQRVKKLGRDVVSARRYTEADIARAQARARVRAFGMTEAQVAAMLRTPDPARAIGTFDLLSPQSGTVINDDFVLGEMAEPGRLLFTVVDESSVWVVAHLAPEDAGLAVPGAPTQVRLKRTGGATLSLPGRVAQVQHQVDEATRTFPVRIEVPNRGHALHPGLFVEVAIQGGSANPQVVIPESAVQRQGTELVVFVEAEPGKYERREVQVGIPAGGHVPVQSGLAPGERVVTAGAFALLSELAKAGFEVHNH